MRTTIALAFIFLVTPVWGSYSLTAREQEILASWLARHTEFRAATDADCNCVDDIQRMRTVSEGVWKVVPEYHPYSVSGDLNGDGLTDFAVVVLERSGSISKSRLLVFNGPFAKNDMEPAFIESGLDLSGRGIFFGPPRPKPYRLVVGGFETDNTMLLIPKAHTYKLAY